MMMQEETSKRDVPLHEPTTSEAIEGKLSRVRFEIEHDEPVRAVAGSIAKSRGPSTFNSAVSVKSRGPSTFNLSGSRSQWARNRAVTIGDDDCSFTGVSFAYSSCSLFSRARDRVFSENPNLPLLSEIHVLAESTSATHLENLLQRLATQIESEGDGGSQAANWLGAPVVILLPVVSALRSLGFSWAQSAGEFSAMSPLMASNVTVAFIQFCSCLGEHGRNEVKLLASWNIFWGMAVVGITTGLSASCRNLALLHCSPDIVEVLSQFQVIALVPTQYLLLHRLPTSPQLVSVFSTVFIASAYTQFNSGSKGNSGTVVNLVGVILTVLSVTIQSFSNTWFELVIEKRRQAASNQAAEVQRCIVAYEVWALMVNVAMAITLDGSNVLRGGPFYGWSWKTVWGAWVPMIVMKLVGTACVVMFGSFVRYLSASCVIVVMYILQCFVLRSIDFSLANFLLLCGLTLCATNFSIIARKIKKEKLHMLAEYHQDLTEVRDELHKKIGDDD